MRIARESFAAFFKFLAAVDLTGAAFPGAVFCIFDCGARVRPTWPGQCLEPEEIFDTEKESWLTLETRFHNIVDGNPLPLFRPEWLDLVAGDMMWEGWFRILAPPDSEETFLMGTYGANHDSQYWALDGTPAIRRRYGGVFIDSGGFLSVRSNTGMQDGIVQSAAPSTGLIHGPNVSDARWHHVAVAWQSTTGGQQITFKFKVLAADLLIIMEKPDLYEDILEIIHTFIAAAAAVPKDFVTYKIYDDSYREPIPKGWRRFGVNSTINPPMHTNGDISDTIRRLSARKEFAQELTVLIWERIYATYPNNGFPVKLHNDGPIEVANVTFPIISEVGSAHLYVDFQKQPGAITYVPGTDNIAADQQLVIAGGHLNRPLHAEVRRFRLWNTSLTADELQEVSQCRMQTLSSVTGGAYPHSLLAEYPLNGDFNNARATDFESVQVSANGGSFIRGGACNIEKCPEASEEGCPLMKKRALNFNSSQTCEAYARFNFCRTAGPNRQGVFQVDYEGCHAGGGNPIAEITL